MKTLSLVEPYNVMSGGLGFEPQRIPIIENNWDFKAVSFVRWK